jgi:hypothetical protein
VVHGPDADGPDFQEYETLSAVGVVVFGSTTAVAFTAGVAVNDGASFGPTGRPIATGTEASEVFVPLAYPAVIAVPITRSLLPTYAGVGL